MSELKRERVGDVLQALYDSEFHVRVEWLWDAGFSVGPGLEDDDMEDTCERQIEKAIQRLAEMATADAPESVFARRWNTGEFFK